MEQKQKDAETLLNTFKENIESQQDQNFSQDDNVVPKKRWKEEKTMAIPRVRPEICEQMFLIED